ncbi:holin [Stutzerimonas nitrititolerans]|uniref:holin n=1 Tax=Stutzerimonas nitrititolerans TaxID=2482751 RepID=UPI000E84E646|nr:holin [Stutzerimonas nitrititolerans]HAR06383.1 holin [Pseudomonas sp.]
MANRTELTVEVVGASVGNKMMGVGAGTGVVAWLASVNWLGLAGVLVAVLGLVANVWFQHRRDRREAAESAARIAAMQDRCGL